ncbi:hypothetical protein JHW45_11945 [Paracoccus stylophorae]|uniref:AtuA-like ferredoxin-fold domain-containing protein n=1 Tax=Paracoccus stylophorae TaxID=659350 RepID=A0ABY7SS59_9RHOB|nr:hypothetical protein [Paracoccus stylophorae]WCR09793.1 hypothetical protein JHW45_11945 [Paracoccus stylophorae]
MKLREIAHSRTGDKGDKINLSLIAFDRSDYARLRAAITAESVASRFASLAAGPVERFELPQLGAMNFVIHNVHGGGVTRTLAQDAHGKCWSSAFLDMDLPKED